MGRYLMQLSSVGIFLSEEKKVQLEEGVTNGEGKYSYTLKTDKSWEPGKYNVKVGVAANGYKDEYNTAKTFKVKISKIVNNK
jgi:5-hydroxyisourate hydrolase-like protein (transthyretin family)